ncbi:MAG: MBL fold metallo-hydrolase [Gammaproteobacteria bacterium]|nr:MBL fold metallo-hydrolase [Gammaproteobacteria bacterium]
MLLTNIVKAEEEDNPYKDVQIETVKISKGLYMLIGAGGNIGLSVGEDGVFMIDDQFAPMTPKIKAAVAAITDQPIKFLINTHWHFDHTGGNENLGKENVLIVAHDNVYKRMSVDSLIGAFGMTVPASPKVALPVITFNDTTTFHLNGDDIHVFHQQNAHTDGDSIIHFKKANVVHTGDVWFNQVYPFIDTSSGGSLDGIIRGAENLLTIVDKDTKIIPGHGPLASKSDLEGYLKMLKTLRMRMQKLIDEGKTIDEIVALKPYADYDKTLGQAFMKPVMFLRIVHDSLTRQEQ